MSDKVLIVYVDRKTGKYKRFECYPYDGNPATKENVEERVRAWNNNAKLDTNAKIYDDELLCEMARDARISCSRNSLINSLINITRDIEESIDDLNSWSDDIKSAIATSGVMTND